MLLNNKNSQKRIIIVETSFVSTLYINNHTHVHNKLNIANLTHIRILIIIVDNFIFVAIVFLFVQKSEEKFHFAFE